ncbi:MAG: Acetyltransf 6 protein [Patescibacteria group bacterium]|jgi:hypothetical protein|nr:Acetyltransf 6 protein [Patescibacteria group bacterium]
MNNAFQELTDTSKVRSPFWSEAWERVLTTAFPYIQLRHFVYRGTHAVRVAQIGDRITSAPFSDGGDVVALAEAPIELESFRADFIERFGTESMVRVHEHLAKVVPTALSADIIDYHVALKSFSIDSVRKTLRHILDEEMPQGADIRRANISETNRVYALYLDTMHEAGGIALPREAFEDLMHRDVFVFVLKGKIEAASVFFANEASAYHFISASSRAGKSVHAPHHILFYAIKQFQQAGELDLFLGGTNASSSLRTFKEGWRGEECKIYTVSGSPACAGRSAHEAARQSPLRALWKLVPTSLLSKATKLIGKRVF